MNSSLLCKTPNVAVFLTVYGLSHALIDASCVFLLLGAIDVREQLLFYVLLYNALAFGLQVPFGFLLDKYVYPRFVSIVGLLCVCVAYFVMNHPLLAVVLAGIGNALFHVGGGKVALEIDYRKASFAGIFVAPGGIGLALGIYLSMFYNYWLLLIFPISLLAMSIALFFTKLPVKMLVQKSTQKVNYALLIIVLLMLSIAIRSVIGLTISFPWKSHVPLLIVLTLAIALGKSLGGFLADRFGWMNIGLGGLLVAIPFLLFGVTIPAMGILGICLFNFTMPITLVAISNVLPNRAGFSFGLTTLALLIGAMPTFTKYKIWFVQQWLVVLCILLASVALYFALAMWKKQNKGNKIADVQ